MAWKITFNMEDGEGHLAPVELLFSENAPDGVTAITYDDVNGVLGDLTTWVDGMTLGRIVSREIAHIVPYVGTAADPHSEVELKGVFTVRAEPTEGSPRGKVARISIPTLDKNLIIIGGTDRMNQALASVAGFIGFITGADSPPLVPIDSSGTPLVALVSAKEGYGKKRRSVA